MTEKLLKDMTHEEIVELAEEVRNNATPEELKTLEQIGTLVNDFYSWWNSEEVTQKRATIGALFEGLRELLPAVVEVMEEDPKYKDMTIHEMLDSGEFEKVIDLATARLEHPRAPGMLSERFLPMVTGTANTLLYEMSIKYAKFDPKTKKAEITTKHGKLEIDKFDELNGALSTSAKKIMDTALLYLTKENFYRGTNVNPTVEIPLIEYGEANGYCLTPSKMATPEEQEKEDKRIASRIKDLKKSIRRDLDDYKKMGATFTEKYGANAGDYANLSIISSHSIVRGKIRINFDIDAARYFIRSHMTQFPTVLLKHDNHRPNSYVIGRKIAIHNAMDNNWAVGSDCTLSVRTLLDFAPEIPTIEDLERRKARNWKDKIKRPLEVALDDNVAIGYLSRWEYRDPTTGTRYTSATAQPLTWAEYGRLMVDFSIIDPPDQTERRTARLAAKVEHAQEAGKQPKKKGRPPKKRVTEEQQGGDRGTTGG